LPRDPSWLHGTVGHPSRPASFRQDLIALFDLLQQKKLKPLIARRFPLVEARNAHEFLGKGGVIGKIVLVSTGAT
jgi:NADPH2:quinone reductase